MRLQDSVDARALVAVGMNGDMVIISVDSENFDLFLDAKAFPAEKALWLSGAPETPGLYEFKGYTAFEAPGDIPPVAVHKGTLELVVAY
jgi:hypothetical protein